MSCPSDYLALNLLGCEYSYSVIFAMIRFLYTDAVTGTEPGDQLYTSIIYKYVEYILFLTKKNTDFKQK